MTDVLITGGAGFIGSALAARLVGRGHTVVALDSLHPQVHPGGRAPTLADGCRLVVGDVREVEAWDAALGEVTPQVVVHLAAETGTGQSMSQATRHASVNVVGTAAMTDALLRHGAPAPHVVLASSRAVYGEGAWVDEQGTVFRPGPRTDADLAAGRWDPAAPSGLASRPLPARASVVQPCPASVYAATKLAQEHLLQSWCAANRSPLSVLRLQNVYGPGQSLTNSYTGIVSLFCQQAMRGDRIDLYEDGNVLRDFVYVDDVVDALTRCVDQTPTGHRLLDVGAGVPTSIAALAAALAGMHGAPEPGVSGRYRPGDVRDAWADTSETESELGWRAVVGLEDGLRRLSAWIAEMNRGAS